VILNTFTADKSVFFDWSNTVGLPNQYTYSYAVVGGAAVTGTTVPSSLQVLINAWSVSYLDTVSYNILVIVLELQYHRSC
jgi:hypothetical protein